MYLEGVTQHNYEAFKSQQRGILAVTDSRMHKNELIYDSFEAIDRLVPPGSIHYGVVDIVPGSFDSVDIDFPKCDELPIFALTKNGWLGLKSSGTSLRRMIKGDGNPVLRFLLEHHIAGTTAHLQYDGDRECVHVPIRINAIQYGIYSAVFLESSPLGEKWHTLQIPPKETSKITWNLNGMR